MRNAIFKWLAIATVTVGSKCLGARKSLMQAEPNIRLIAQHAMASMERATDQPVMN